MRDRIIPEWRAAWRMLSAQVGLAMVIFGALPEAQQAAILELLRVPASRLPALLGLAVIVARLTRQPNVPKE